MNTLSNRPFSRFIRLTAAGASVFGLAFAGSYLGRAFPVLTAALPTVIQPASEQAFAQAHAESGINNGSAPAPLTTSAPDYIRLAERVLPSVVNISTTKRLPRMQRWDVRVEMFPPFMMPFGQPYGEGWQMPRGQEEPESEDESPRTNPAKRSVAHSLGTGFIIDPKGIILTNHHVIDGADEVFVQFTESIEEKPTLGKVIGRDRDLDVALIEVKINRELKALPLGDSDRVRVGEYVAAVGNPMGQGHTVTHGIISYKDRPSPMMALTQYIQTDTPINPGNSGGPLVNLSGEVIAINNAIDARAQSIGFAIPINAVKKILPELRRNGKVSRGQIGIAFSNETLQDGTEGIVVQQVTPGSPADEAGLQPGDRILAVGERKIRSANDLVGAIRNTPIGKAVDVKIKRGSKEPTKKITVGSQSRRT